MTEDQSNISLLDMSTEEATKFFLKSETYFNVDLPSYINFSNLLQNLWKEYKNFICNNPTKISFSKEMSQSENVHYVIYVNKNDKYSWRDMSILHPLFYIDLVYEITKEENWKKIKERFQTFQKKSKIECLSIPVESKTRKNTDKSEQVKNWWKKVEQESMALSLEYDYMLITDISDCYSSIYTHSIA